MTIQKRTARKSLRTRVFVMPPNQAKVPKNQINFFRIRWRGDFFIDFMRAYMVRYDIIT